MRGVIALFAVLASASCATSRSAVGAGMLDAEGYAIASCLSKQKESLLQQQGGGWASVIIERGSVTLDNMRVIDDSVRHAVAKGGILVVHDESSPSGDAPLPVLYCVQIGNDLSVRKAIDAAMQPR
jgi:hypothetical protein